MAVGSPFNLSSTVTQGIISAKGRSDLGISAYEDFLQTDAAINPGNSGGALVDINGDLVGINTAILSGSGGNQGIGLAIPANLARSLGAQLAQTGRVTRGWLGVTVQPLTGDVGDQLGLQDGVLVTGVYPQSPAGQVPWSQRGTEVILKVNGQTIDSPGELRNLVANAKPGAALQLEVWSDGQTREYNLKAGTRPARAQGVLICRRMNSQPDPSSACADTRRRFCIASRFVAESFTTTALGVGAGRRRVWLRIHPPLAPSRPQLAHAQSFLLFR